MRALNLGVASGLLCSSLAFVGCEAPEPPAPAETQAATAEPKLAERTKAKRQVLGTKAPKQAARAPEPETQPAAVGSQDDGAEARADTADADSESPEACPADMALVHGSYCRNVSERCLEYVSDIEGSPDLTRCKRFAEPTQCTDTQPRREMRFCMDKYEWPNKQGEIPHTLVSWEDAARMCNSQGKRLCTESEFTFACEGEAMLPHATGHERDDKKCNIDREFKKRRKEMKPREQCELNATCKAEMERLDGREASGARAECVSPFGIYDMNGNVNEWVSMPWKSPGKRSAIKGGWWGPVRNRCRPIVQSHGETYIGYEVGFRCCSAADQPAKAAVSEPTGGDVPSAVAAAPGLASAGRPAPQLAPEGPPPPPAPEKPAAGAKLSLAGELAD